jgi:hypothetical protein
MFNKNCNISGEKITMQMKYKRFITGLLAVILIIMPIISISSCQSRPKSSGIQGRLTGIYECKDENGWTGTIEFIDQNNIYISEYIVIKLAGTYILNGNTLVITANVFEDEQTEVFTVSSDGNSFYSGERTYIKRVPSGWQAFLANAKGVWDDVQGWFGSLQTLFDKKEEGVDKTSVSSKNSLTREEFCDLAVPLYEKIEGKFRLSRLMFDDTDNQNVMHMANIGVVDGYPNSNGTTSFKPQNEVTRQEAAVMFCRLIEALGHELVQVDPTFTDVRYDEENKWSYYYIGKIEAAGIMDGVGNNMFDPFGKFSREQNEITMMKVWDLIKYLCPVPITWDNPVNNFLYDEIPEREKYALTAWGKEFWKFESYNIEHSGMIVEKWEHIKYSNGTLNVKFTLHNNNATAGEVLVFDKNNILVGRKIISAYVENPTNLESYLRGVWEQTIDTVTLDWIFNQQKVNSKSTDIDINIPKDGYIVIHNDTGSSDSLKLLYTMDQIGRILSFASKGISILNQKNLNDILNNTVEKNKLDELEKTIAKLYANGFLPYLLSLNEGDVTMGTITTTWSNFSKIVKELMTSEDFYSLLNKLSPDMDSKDTYISLVFGISEKTLMTTFSGTPATVAINGMFMATGGANFMNAVRSCNRTLSSGYVRIDNR